MDGPYKTCGIFDSHIQEPLAYARARYNAAIARERLNAHAEIALYVLFMTIR